MSETAAITAVPSAGRAPKTGRTLRLLFLTLFLRGRSSRGLRKETAPSSIGGKLGLSLGLYALIGCSALAFIHQPVFALSVYLHVTTFMFVGMFVAASAGEVLFNKEEADILLHRPVTARDLLWSKISVLVQVSLWLAGAFNAVAILAGMAITGGHWLFPLAHVISTAAEALFCSGSVVLVYQLCLRWFGRERLDGLMTTAQVFIAIFAVLAGQLPRFLFAFGKSVHLDLKSWWVFVLPPAWFAGFDDAVAGSGSPGAWVLAGVGLLATTIVLWLAFDRLAEDYGAGLQTMGESVTAKPKQIARRRWLHRLVDMPPLKWWLRDSVTRASFLLSAAYLLRDREVKLRVYPGLAPFMVMPMILLLNEHGHMESGWLTGFGITAAGVYIGIVPLTGLSVLQYSQQWQASDLFRAAPISGPSRLCAGARKAILLSLTLPLFVVLAVFAWIFQGGARGLLSLLPGLLALPVLALVPCVSGNAVPLSRPAEEAKSAQRGLIMIAASILCMFVAVAAGFAWSYGFFQWFLLGEAIVAAALYFPMRWTASNLRWEPME